MAVEIQTLPQKHSILWDTFKEVENKQDEEAYEVLLADGALWDQFYERLSAFARIMAIAMASEDFLENTS